MMARPPQGNLARPRAIAGTFNKPTPTPAPLTPHSIETTLTPSPSPQIQPHVSHPETSTSPYYQLIDESSIQQYQQHDEQPTWQQVSNASNLMPPPTSFSPRHSNNLNLMSSPSAFQPSSSTSVSPLSSSLGSQNVSPMFEQQFGQYPQPYPSNPFLPAYAATADPSSVFAPMHLGQLLDSHVPPNDIDSAATDAWVDYDSVVQTPDEHLTTPVQSSPTKKGKAVVNGRTPRPPNAWILYRSHILQVLNKDGPDTASIPGLDDAMSDLGIKPGASGTDSTEGESSLDERRNKKAHKDSKEPAAGMLQKLGVGKNGRGIPQADVSRLISLLWKREDAVVKAKYEKMSDDKKKEHQRMYPGYKFQPLRKSDKERLKHEKEAAKQKLRDERQANKSKSTRGRRIRASPTSAMSSRDSRELSRGIINERGIYIPGDAIHRSSLATNTPSSFPNTPEGLDEDHHFRSYPFPIPGSSLPAMQNFDVGPLAFDKRYAFHPVSEGKISLDNPKDPLASVPGSPSRRTSELQPTQLASFQTPPPTIEVSVPNPSVEGLPSAPHAPSIISVPVTKLPKPFLIPGYIPHGVEKGADPCSSSKRKGDNPKRMSTKLDRKGKRSAAPARRASHLANSWINSDSEGEADEVFAKLSEGDAAAEAEGQFEGVIIAAQPQDNRYSRPSTSANGSFASLELRSVVNQQGDGWIAVPVPDTDAQDGYPYGAARGEISTVGAPDGAYVYPGIYPPYSNDFAQMDPATYDQMTAMAHQNTYSGEGQPLYIYHTAQGPMVPMNLQVEEGGPFLIDGPLFSPAEAGFNIPALPSNAAPSMWQGSNATSYSGDTNIMPYNTAPRHVSTSAYPLTPQSMTHLSLPNGSGTWNDRSTSFAFAGFQFPEEVVTGEDMLNWDEGGENPMDPTQWNLDVQFMPAQDPRSRRPSSNGGPISRIPTPISESGNRTVPVQNAAE